MSKNRCFSNPNDSNTSSSDYTKQTKQQTIFTDVVNQVQTQTNFIKSNGVNYNENFGLHNQCLAFAKSYELLLDVTKGKYYTVPTQDPKWVSNEAWSAGLYSVDYSANQVNTVVDTSYNAGNGNQIIFPMTQPAELADLSWNGLYPGVRVDPSYNIFYNQCKDQNYWRKKLVDMSFNNTNYSNQSKQISEQLYGMSYPGNVTFACAPVIIPERLYGSKQAGFITGSNIDSTTGALTKIAGSPFPIDGTNPVDIISDPTGNFLYTSNIISNNISAYKITAANGTLTRITGSPFSTASGVNSLAIHPTKPFLYVTDNNTTLISGLTYDTTTGTLTNISTTPFDTTLSRPTEIAIHPTKPFLYSANEGTTGSGYTDGGIVFLDISLNSLNLGALTFNTAYLTGDRPTQIVIDNSGKILYYSDLTSKNVISYVINQTNGTLTSRNIRITLSTIIRILLIHPILNILYVFSDSGYINIYTIDTTAGILTEIPGSLITNLELGDRGAVFSKSGKFLYITKSNTLPTGGVIEYNVNLLTGILTYVNTYIGADIVSPVALTTT